MTNDKTELQKTFLKEHNWVIEDGIAEHPLYPLAEDVSTKDQLDRFIEGMYKQAWMIYYSITYVNNDGEE